jgi:hypothetical protein
MPPHLNKGSHLMFGQELPHADRNVLIEYDAQYGGSRRK